MVLFVSQHGPHRIPVRLHWRGLSVSSPRAPPRQLRCHCPPCCAARCPARVQASRRALDAPHDNWLLLHDMLHRVPNGVSCSHGRRIPQRPRAPIADVVAAAAVRQQVPVGAGFGDRHAGGPAGDVRVPAGDLLQLRPGLLHHERRTPPDVRVRAGAAAGVQHWPRAVPQPIRLRRLHAVPVGGRRRGDDEARLDRGVPVPPAARRGSARAGAPEGDAEGRQRAEPHAEEQPRGLPVVHLDVPGRDCGGGPGHALARGGPDDPLPVVVPPA
mmetsp:Transcript_43958/g.74121  ORF Transcript_43958/g.74121 Transcript_43958/m.74121 type:complete len:271 (-) Transcript_43958:503-1315(-)